MVSGGPGGSCPPGYLGYLPFPGVPPSLGGLPSPGGPPSSGGPPPLFEYPLPE